jgi:NitT/TauT family transport system substrate-binding protein
MKIGRFMKTSAILLALIFFIMALAGCAQTAPSAPDASSGSSGSKESGAYTVKFAAFLGYSGLGTALGEKKGFFQENGLNTEFTWTTSGDKIALLLSGDADFADVSTSNAIIAIAHGAPVKIVGSVFRTKGAFYVIANNDIKNAADLKGKKIGISIPGTGMEATVFSALKKIGLDPDRDVTLIANGIYQEAYASLQAGQVDATVIHQPFVALAEKEGIGHLMYKGYDVIPDLHTGVLLASDKFIRDHPEDFKKILAAYYKSWIYAKEHMDETVAFGSKYIDIDADVLKSALDSEMIIWDNIPQVNIDAINKTQDIQIELGFQDEKYDISGSIDERFLPDAATLASFSSLDAQ